MPLAGLAPAWRSMGITLDDHHPGATAMTGPEARRIGLGRALEEFEALLAKWCADDQPVDLDELTRLAVYEKD